MLLLLWVVAVGLSASVVASFARTVEGAVVAEYPFGGVTSAYVRASHPRVRRRPRPKNIGCGAGSAAARRVAAGVTGTGQRCRKGASVVVCFAPAGRACASVGVARRRRARRVGSGVVAAGANVAGDVGSGLRRSISGRAVGVRGRIAHQAAFARRRPASAAVARGSAAQGLIAVERRSDRAVVGTDDAGGATGVVARSGRGRFMG